MNNKIYSQIIKHNQDRLQRPQIGLYEGWQDLVGGIDLNVWAVTDPAGAAWANAVAADLIEAASTLNLNDTSRLYGRQPWPCFPTLWGSNYVSQRLNMEWEMRMTNLANLDNTACFWGLASATNVTRASNNLIGFGLNTDVLEAFTDNAGAETAHTSFGETLTNINKLRIAVIADQVTLYLNDVQIAIVATNLPDAAMYPMFYWDTEAGGGSVVEVGVVRVWPEDIT